MPMRFTIDEITEFFIAWLQEASSTTPFKDWTWDSRRPLAIKGDGEDFRKGDGAGIQSDGRSHA